MTTNRRAVIGGLALSVSAFRVAAAAEADGHAAGMDVAAAGNPVALIPRKSGDPTQFTASLDKAALKATSGGWAREITSRSLPLASNVALAHLFVNAGGAREMHWHNSAEWAYVLGGQCQITVVAPDAESEIVNLGPGDVWYFPRGHAHAIQTLGTDPFHALLAFDDGLYSEHGTFGFSDWISRLDADVLAQATGVAAPALAGLPKGETYIMQGGVIALDSRQARDTAPLAPERSHRFPLMEQAPWAVSSGGTMRVVDSRNFPIAGSIAGTVLQLQPGAMQQLHWHPGGSEFLYVSRGRVSVTLLEAEKRMASAMLSPGDCAYIPANCGHMLRNTGTEMAEIVSALDMPIYSEANLNDWLSKAPRHLLANNMAMSEAALPDFPKIGSLIPATP